MAAGAAMKCQARIRREFKRRRADSVWPESESDGVRREFPDNLRYPECGGVVTAEVAVESRPYYGGVDYRLLVALRCSRCRSPYIRGFEAIRHAVAMTGVMDVTAAVEAATSESGVVDANAQLELDTTR